MASRQLARERRQVWGQLSQAQQAEALEATQKGPPGPWATHTQDRLRSRPLGRSSLAGPQPEAPTSERAKLPTGGSQGNAGIIRGAPTQGTRYGGGRYDGTQYSIPAPGTGSHDARDYTTYSRTGLAFQNGHTIVYDRHVMSKTGSETQRAHPDSTGGQGLSPLADGPVRPVYMLVHRTYAPRNGNDGTRHLDNSGPFAVTQDNAGRTQPLGIQDGSPWSRKYGGTPGLTYVQGMRGTAGVQSPVPVGAPGDGPQLIRGGVPHGLHAIAQPNAQLRTRRMAATPQQKRTRRSLPKNSSRAGQSWSQNAQTLGGAATPVPKVGGRLPGQAARTVGRG